MPSLRLKHGTIDPSASDFSDTAELLVNTTDGGLFTKDDSNNVVEIGSGGGGSSTLSGLTDVTLGTISGGQVLKYNGSAWVNDTDATGGGGGGSTDLLEIMLFT